MSDREIAMQLCLMTHHDWVEEYYGYKCSQCGDFIPYGCEPWMPFDDDDVRQNYIPGDEEEE